MTAFVPLISAMEGTGRRTLRALYPLISEDAPVVDIHVAMEGTWEGHPSGPFTLDRAGFEQAVANFARHLNPIPLDYEHSSVYSAEAPAAGWIQALEIRDDSEGAAHLWAKAELTDKAAGYVREGAYRFSSGVFEFESTDRQSGESLGLVVSSIALTNLPFISGQTPIQLSRRAASALPLTTKKEPHMKVSKDALKAAIDGLEGDDIDMAKLNAAMDYAAAQEGKTEEPAEEAPAADMPEDIPAADPPSEEEESAPLADKPEPKDEKPEPKDEKKLGDEPEGAVPAGDMPEEVAAMEGGEADAALAPLLEETGLDLAGLAAAIMENREALAALLSGDQAPAAEAPLSEREADLALSARDTTIRALSQQVEELKAFRADVELKAAEADVDVLVEGGFILGDAREDWVAVRLSSRERFDKMASGLKPVVPLGKHALSSAPAAKDAPDDTPIPEDEEWVKRHRLQLSAAKIPPSRQDEIIRRHVVARG